MDELISKIDVNAIQESIRKGVEYGGEFFLRFQNFVISSSLFWVIFSSILFFTPFFFYKKMWNYLKDENIEPFITAPLLVHIFILIVLCTNVLNLLKAIYVPEIYLLEYLNR